MGKRFKIWDNIQSVGFKTGAVLSAGTFFSGQSPGFGKTTGVVGGLVEAGAQHNAQSKLRYDF
jgi:hypothetical protein